jgi:hypothetical protein
MKKRLKSNRGLIMFLTAAACVSLIIPTEAHSRKMKTEIEAYSFLLSPQQITGEYSRKEIENFLCSCAMGFIRSEDVYKLSDTGDYIVLARPEMEQHRLQVETAEITRWFEETVTVTSRGKVTSLDVISINRFFDNVNRIIGERKFIYKPDMEVANIVIEMAGSSENLDVLPLHGERWYVGETAVLDDNLRIRIIEDNENVSYDTYNSGAGRLISRSQQIIYNEKEKEFRKENRFVKIHIRNIIEPLGRHNSLVHECLHAIGFPGHSPYHESNLFPLSVPTSADSFKNSPFTPLAETMIEMLYRPEILPGISVKEAGIILSRLKRPQNTDKKKTEEFLGAKEKVLKKQKEELLKEAKKIFSQKMTDLIYLDGLIHKELRFLDELKEIKEAGGQKSSIVKDITTAPNLIRKLTRLRTDMIIGKSKKRKLQEQLNAGLKGSAARRARRQIKLIDEEQVVIDDLIRIAKRISQKESDIEPEKIAAQKEQIETKLRRVIRQLSWIEMYRNKR